MGTGEIGWRVSLAVEDAFSPKLKGLNLVLDFHRLQRVVNCRIMNSADFVPKVGELVLAPWHTGRLKVLAVSSDGSTATVQQFSVSKQLLLGNPMTGIPCSTLSPVRKEDASQATGIFVREDFKNH